MRSNQNPSGPLARSVGERSSGAQDGVAQGVEGSVVTKLGMPQMPVEWLDAGSWRLPSGKALAEFALQAGFLAPLLFRADRFGKSSSSGSSKISGSLAQVRGKQFDKGDGR
jgi:hypothetical protein